MQGFYQELARTLKYPLVARFVNKEGLALIKFIVDEHGKLTDFAPISKEGFGFEKRVIEKLQKFPDWNPAIFKNRNVKMRFVLPIRYKLTN
jgi:periplasmic protein TonB